MTQEQIKEHFLKIGHDLAGQRRCFDLVNTLLHEGVSNLEDAKNLLSETIVQLNRTQETISTITVNFQKKLENKSFNL
ncbi:MAG: hypothetical protein A4S09_06575 [Proteobacteria bacterium SG_bin7]|nr:MAG: hypothetical protein A4S09_06575 [Proteobacteria bacterium SG_bin7]